MKIKFLRILFVLIHFNLAAYNCQQPLFGIFLNIFPNLSLVFIFYFWSLKIKIKVSNGCVLDQSYDASRCKYKFVYDTMTTEMCAQFCQTMSLNIFATSSKYKLSINLKYVSKTYFWILYV